MWLGMLDAEGKAIWPGAVGRVDGDLVVWSIAYAAYGKVFISNLDHLVFPVHRDIECPKFVAFFREIDSAEPFYTPMTLLGTDHVGIVKAGRTLGLAKGTVSMTTPAPMDWLEKNPERKFDANG